MSGRRTMVRHLLGWAGLLLTLSFSAAVAQQDALITIARIAGQVEVRHETETSDKWVGARMGQTIGNGWRLRTGDKSKVQLVLPQDNVVILKENSVLNVDTLEPGGGGRIGADQGGLLVDLRNALSPGSDFELATPSALAVVRGTKFGAAGITDEQSTFYGYEDTVLITNDQGSSTLSPDTTIDAHLGEAPSDPYPSGPDATAFLASAEDTGEFDAAVESAADALARLGRIDRGLDRVDDTLQQYEEEWARYEHGGHRSRMVFLYAGILAVRDEVDRLAGDLGDVVERYTESEVWNQPLAAGMSSLPDGLGEGATVGDYRDWLEKRIDDLYAKLGGFDDEAEPFIADQEDLLDRLRGLIPPGNPALGLRYKLIDTDNDGLSDVDEIELGLDPEVSNSADGFITLVAPDDGDSVDYPATGDVTFEFEPLEGDLVSEYVLVLEAGGVQWQQGHVDSSTTVQLAQLIGQGGVFADQVEPDGTLNLEWYILARLNQDELFQEVHLPLPGVAQPNSIPSEKRALEVHTPTQSATVIIDLTPVGSTSLRVGDALTIQAHASQVNALGEWEIRIEYDPTLLEFAHGNRLGLLGGSTVFFGGEGGGVLSVSGSAPHGGGGISGEGPLFELQFAALEAGMVTVEVSEVLLTDVLDREIDAEPGTPVDATISS